MSSPPPPPPPPPPSPSPPSPPPTTTTTMAMIMIMVMATTATTVMYSILGTSTVEQGQAAPNSPPAPLPPLQPQPIGLDDELIIQINKKHPKMLDIGIIWWQRIIRPGHTRPERYSFVIVWIPIAVSEAINYIEANKSQEWEPTAVSDVKRQVKDKADEIIRVGREAAEKLVENITEHRYYFPFLFTTLVGKKVMVRRDGEVTHWGQLINFQIEGGMNHPTSYVLELAPGTPKSRLLRFHPNDLFANVVTVGTPLSEDWVDTCN